MHKKFEEHWQFNDWHIFRNGNKVYELIGEIPIIYFCKSQDQARNRFDDLVHNAKMIIAENR